MELSDNIKKIVKLNSKLSEFTRIVNKINFIPESFRQVIEIREKFKLNIPTLNVPTYNFSKFDLPQFKPFMNSELLERIKELSKIRERVKNNPELQFGFISDLEILNLKSAEELRESLILDLSDEDILEKEELLNKNLLPYLEYLEIDSLWIGANQVLESKLNPDRLRHCLVSLRTILEFLINQKLAPVDKLKNSEKFEKEFRKYNLGKQKIEQVRITRAQKIEYFISNFNMLEEFTKNEIQYVCDCYSILCNIHQPNIGITENQVRSLKVKTGITIWLLAYLYKILEKENDKNNKI